MSSGMAKRLMGDVKEIVSQTFRDSPAVFIEEYTPPQGVNLKGPTYTALVIGPPETPYAHGFFLFRISVDCCYPNTCPAVLFLSTDGGNVRLNPNLYANGKVCLSILGTWAGDKWRCSYSLLYLLRCLQSMVLVQDPFFNEPGTDRACRESQLMSGHYTNRIFHESMRVTVLNVVEALLKITPPDVPSMIRAEEKSNPLTGAAGTPPTPVSSAADGSMSPNVPDTPGLSEVGNDEAFPSMTPDGTPVISTVPTLLLPEQVGLPRGAAMNNFVRTLHAPFAPWIKRYCYVWLESYEAALSRPEALALDHTVMKVPPFCKLSATQESTFQHENLLERIRNVGAALDEETASWRREGEEVGKAGLENHYYGRVMVEALRVFDVDGVMASLEDDTNPFVWNFLILNPNSPTPASSTADDDAEQSSCCSHHPATNIYEQSMYRVEAVFCPSSSSEPPRLRFMQPIWHPNISPRRGVPFCFSCEAAIAGDDRFLPRTVAKQLWELLAMAPLSSLTAAVNPEAHRLCFSQNENDRVLFLRRARNLAASTLE